MIARQAFLAHAEKQNLRCDTIIRDHDGKYTSEFDCIFQKRGIAAKPVGPRAPNLNAFIEPWIQSLKHEALNHFAIFAPRKELSS
jgi:putative transposase